MKTILNFFCVVGALVFAATAHAQCVAGKNPAEMTQAEMRALYECIRPGLAAGYQKRGKNPIAAAYTSWQAASTTPAAPGVHSGQYLMTYVNPASFAAYTAFKTDGVNMPVGTLIAKENFSFKKNGKLKKGPLLMMEKVGLDAAPDTGGWIYSGVKPNGKKLKVKQKDFCHACHQAWPGQDYLGYPVKEVRVSAGY